MGCTCSSEDPLTHIGPLDVWNSRRSSVYSTKGICSCSQPIASSIGAKILSQGGNAADAAVAMAAALNVLEPCSTGIGGDAFVLYYEAKTKKVYCLQGNGASSANISLDMLKKRGIGLGSGLSPLPFRSGLCVTVPGAPALWDDVVTKFGRKSLREVLSPAIKLAREGFPVSPVTAEQVYR
jgi:gamma-glutamyltranspeptidase/glutathione hydrolase